ncbi:DUF2199 domain-containing protein [Pseudovibrio sp. JE062]|uniref:DUF2199 domain-containing protein n=1 Tax=Pseudovibrio sp. JE062 TaxID=439495 RepID=UPI0018DD02B6|nr:DUF2199 domain-containing protein [Pseudovibrio sp. JE062]
MFWRKQKKLSFKYRCDCCGQVYDDAPSVAYDAPFPFLWQDKEVQEAGHLDANRCVYKDEDGEHFFIRATMDIPVHGLQETFLWGLWVSVSEESFQDYALDSEENLEGRGYFGYLANNLAFYGETCGLPANVELRSNNLRPNVLLHIGDHELIRDQYHGISIEKARQIFHLFLHRPS